MTDQSEAVWSFLRTVRKRLDSRLPVLVLIGGGHLSDLEHRDELFDERGNLIRPPGC